MILQSDQTQVADLDAPSRSLDENVVPLRHSNEKKRWINFELNSIFKKTAIPSSRGGWWTASESGGNRGPSIFDGTRIWVWAPSNWFFGANTYFFKKKNQRIKKKELMFIWWETLHFEWRHELRDEDDVVVEQGRYWGCCPEHFQGFFSEPLPLAFVQFLLKIVYKNVRLYIEAEHSLLVAGQDRRNNPILYTWRNRCIAPFTYLKIYRFEKVWGELDCRNT